MNPFRVAVEARDFEGAVALLADDVVFRSPVVFRPYEGRDVVSVLLLAVSRVFEDFLYEREIGEEGARDHALVFKARRGSRDTRLRLPAHQRGRADRRLHRHGPAAVGRDGAR